MNPIYQHIYESIKPKPSQYWSYEESHNIDHPETKETLHLYNKDKWIIPLSILEIELREDHIYIFKNQEPIPEKTHTYIPLSDPEIFNKIIQIAEALE